MVFLHSIQLPLVNNLGNPQVKIADLYPYPCRTIPMMQGYGLLVVTGQV